MYRGIQKSEWTPDIIWGSLIRLLQNWTCDPTHKNKKNARDLQKATTKERKRTKDLAVLSPFLLRISKCWHLHRISGFWWGAEWGSPGIGWGSSPTVTPTPDQVPLQQDPSQDLLPLLVYNSESEPDSDNELDPELSWREVQDIPSFQLREAMRNPQQPTENDSFSFQNTTPPLNLIASHDRDGLQGDLIGYVNQYTLKVQQSLTRYFESFQSSDLRYSLLLNMTMDNISSVLHEITCTQIETIDLIDNIHGPKDFRMKRSLLPFGRLFNFLIRTAKDEDVRSMKQNVKKLYDNQISQSKVLNDIISIANILKGLINENILRINHIVSTITFINDTIDSIMNQLRPLFSARRFLLLHTETLIHHSSIRTLLGQMQTDTAQAKAYLHIHFMGKMTPFITDPVHLRQELLQINKHLPTRLSLPENPHSNVWHYYRFLTMNPVIHRGKHVLMIRIPLIDLDSVMNLYKIYILPIYNHHIGKSLQYLLEGTNLAITKDNKYAVILSDMEFVKCTLADGHFCALDTGL